VWPFSQRPLPSARYTKAIFFLHFVQFSSYLRLEGKSTSCFLSTATSRNGPFLFILLFYFFKHLNFLKHASQRCVVYLGSVCTAHSPSVVSAASFSWCLVSSCVYFHLGAPVCTGILVLRPGRKMVLTLLSVRVCFYQVPGRLVQTVFSA
jgi:hypothetical protein